MKASTPPGSAQIWVRSRENTWQLQNVPESTASNPTPIKTEGHWSKASSPLQRVSPPLLVPASHDPQFERVYQADQVDYEFSAPARPSPRVTQAEFASPWATSDRVSEPEQESPAPLPLLLPPPPEVKDSTQARQVRFDAGIAPPNPVRSETTVVSPDSAPGIAPHPTVNTPPGKVAPESVPPVSRNRGVEPYPFDRIHESDVPSGDAGEYGRFSKNGSYSRTIESMFRSGDPSAEFLGHEDQCDDFPCDGGCLGDTCDGLFHDYRGSDTCRCGRPGCRRRSRQMLGVCGTVRDGRLIPWTSLGVRGSNLRTLGEVDFFYPLWQDQLATVFANLRGQFDDAGSNDGSFGLGYRGLLKPTLVFGTYIFYDVIGSPEGNVFHQGTIGMELLTLNWDFRVNGYFRDSDAKPSGIENGFANGTLVTRDFMERAYSGIDAEFGRRILHWGWNDRCQLHWFLGGYYFDHDTPGYESLAGPRTRVEFRVYDLGFLGEQSRLELGAETTYDNVRDGQFAGFLRVRIPLGAKANRDRIDPMRRRLLDRVYHDVD